MNEEEDEGAGKEWRIGSNGGGRGEERAKWGEDETTVKLSRVKEKNFVFFFFFPSTALESLHYKFSSFKIV